MTLKVNLSTTGTGSFKVGVSKYGCDLIEKKIPVSLFAGEAFGEGIPAALLATREGV